MTKKVIVILGQTASGKSGLAVKIAKQIGGEVLSADSRQVYMGMDIGTGKVTKKEMAGVPHHCLDVASPKKVFTAADFKKCADTAMEKIWAKGKVPIICGGTGFYIDILLGKMQTAEVPPNPRLRKELENKTTEQLFKMLLRLDPERAKNIDAKNPRRLVRAIEIAKVAKKPPLHPLLGKEGHGEVDVLQLGIAWPEDKLKERIAVRTAEMVKHGLIKETQKLKNSGLSWKRIYELGFEYKYPAMFLQGKISKKEMLERMILESVQYSKRQMTWFKRDKNIVWLKPSELKKASSLAKKFLE
jgi:tRNA dimethylallyltransferase